MLAHMSKEIELLHPMVVMCSTSDSDLDKHMAKSFGAAGYPDQATPQFSQLKDIINQGKSLSFCQEGSDYVLRRAA